MSMRKIIPLCFILNIVFATACWAQTAPSLQEKTLAVAGLKDKVIVRRDERGIPYIEAKNEADLFFAQGFVTAQDRLWQMDLYRRVSRGETAEIFGRAALEEDRRWRKFDFARVAEETVNNTSAENRILLDNYARGVNAYIAALDEKSLPVEFQILKYRPREWTAADSIVISKIFDDALSNTWRMDLMKASLMDLPKEKRDWIFNPSSLLDVLLVGKDSDETGRRVDAETRGQDGKLKLSKDIAASARLPISASLLKEDEIRRQSLERIGFYAEDLAASNNWVVGGKRTVDGKTLLANDPHLRPTQPP
ncbi:MAG: penicillin acylase family protein, partial [Acidobacteriota bacterium]|nr:penicillin acylase family protein [Acidobacteriota bacterium]